MTEHQLSTHPLKIHFNEQSLTWKRDTHTHTYTRVLTHLGAAGILQYFDLLMNGRTTHHKESLLNRAVFSFNLAGTITGQTGFMLIWTVKLQQ